MFSEFYLNADLDFALIGLEQRERAYAYYCTPKGADILGWAGVDGIHYCTIPEFGEMVFAVSPMNAGECVHPIARSIRDLFSLLLSCGDLAALEQCHAWDRSQYDTFIRENPVGEKQKAVLGKLQKALDLVPIQDVFAYVKELQDDFDLSRIPYTEDYYDPDMNPDAPLPPSDWAVTYEGGFWNQIGEPGREVVLNQTFVWNRERWFIPSLYLCEEGIVMDYLVQIEPERVNAFIHKWQLQSGEEPFDPEKAEQIQRESPVQFDGYGEVYYNQVKLRRDHSCSVTWVPESCRMEGMGLEREAQEIVEHYELDREKAWVIHRASYRWNGLIHHEPVSLSVRMVRNPERITGDHFEVTSEGEQIAIIHPVTGETHILTPRELCLQELPDPSFPDRGMDFPHYCMVMSYSLEPDLSSGVFWLEDHCKSDQPRPKKQGRKDPGPENIPGAAMGIIGGSDGPTALIFGCASHQNGSAHYTTDNSLHTACSSLHFEKIEKVQWQSVFQVKKVPDLWVTLM